MKKGFTIIELITVIGIIGILMGIVTTAASSSVRMSRTRKAEALCSLVQAGLATYHAQKDEWPISFEGKSRANNEGANNQTDTDIYELSATEVRQCVKALVDEAKLGNPLMDVSGLFVSRSQGERNSRAAYGLDFMQAVRGTSKTEKKMKVGEMFFGYPEAEHGWFRRFKMTYSFPADSITVTQQAADDR